MKNIKNVKNSTQKIIEISSPNLHSSGPNVVNTTKTRLPYMLAVLLSIVTFTFSVFFVLYVSYSGLTRAELLQYALFVVFKLLTGNTSAFVKSIFASFDFGSLLGLMKVVWTLAFAWVFIWACVFVLAYTLFCCFLLLSIWATFWVAQFLDASVFAYFAQLLLDLEFDCRRALRAWSENIFSIFSNVIDYCKYIVAAGGFPALLEFLFPALTKIYILIRIIVLLTRLAKWEKPK